MQYHAFAGYQRPQFGVCAITVQTGRAGKRKGRSGIDFTVVALIRVIATMGNGCVATG